MNTGKIKTAVLKFFFPDFDELTLFLYSLVAFLFIISSSGSLLYSFGLMFKQDSFIHIVFSILIVLVAFAIILLPVIHVFSKRKKRIWEKKIMLYVIVLVDYLVAWNVYYHLEGAITNFLIIFPMINALQATSVVMGLWFEFIGLEKISDKNAGIAEIILSSIILIVLFLLFHFKLHQHWAVTFSVCIFYATIINKIIVQAYRSIKKFMSL